MSVQIGINGFGRIGRNLCRALASDPVFSALEIVGINELTDIETIVQLLKYDSIMGRAKEEIKAGDGCIFVAGKRIPVTACKEPAEIPWRSMGADYVMECTGRFTELEKARAHIDAGAAKVLISAPAKGGVKTLVMGVNEDEYDPAEHDVVSNASCTTNCLAPVAQVLLHHFGIKRGLMTTVHSYTGDQRLVDAPHKDLRRARAAALSMIPTKTGAAAAVALVLPELKNKFDGLAVRVPTPNVSLVDVAVEVECETTVDEVNKALAAAANRFLGYTDEPLVSCDFLGDPRSSIVDGSCTRAMGRLVKVMSWYDNEWGYANRMLDLALYMESRRIL